MKDDGLMIVEFSQEITIQVKYVYALSLPRQVGINLKDDVLLV